MSQTNEPAVGVDIGGHNIRAGVVDAQGRVLSEARRPALADEGPEATLGMVVEAVSEALAEASLGAQEVVGIGMGVPGLHRSAQGICLFSPNFKDWRSVQIVAPIRDAFGGIRTRMLNDVGTATLGEHRHGAGRGYDQVVMITLGTGIGGGAVIDGQLRLGATEGFAEVGHMTIVPDGPRCGCGNHGCWEALAAAEAISQRAIRALQTGRASRLTEAADGRLDLITPALIHEAAAAGDALALEVMHETGMYLGIGVTNLIVLYNPQVIIIGGGIAQAGPMLLDVIQRVATARARMVPASTCRIVPAELGDNAGIVGAAVLAREGVGQRK